jgi:tetratricopeptide (TPR) repeat protein
MKTTKNPRYVPGLLMTIRHHFVMLLSIVFLATSCKYQKETQSSSPGAITICGTVQFSGGCGKESDSLVSYGLALVHHMTYDVAVDVFDEVIESNPDCFWGYWGKALTYIHPLWPDAPNAEQLKMGWDLCQKAMELASKEKEKMYGKTLAAYYENGHNKTEKERLKNLELAWERAHYKNPEDLEVKLFYALSLLSTMDVNDKTYKQQLKAGAMAEEVLQVIPDHPGAFHYAIHAYDYPALSSKAIELANNYDKIAPEIPHALHMPTHIFTREGMWKESIEWNTRSAKAALKNPVNNAVSMHYFHALDYLVYAHLQRLEDNEAKKVLKDVKNLARPYQDNFATAYALAAMEGRLALERQEWDKAARLEIPDFAWERYPESEALTHFAIGLGGARSGLPDIAEVAIGRLDELQKKANNEYWQEQIDIQKNSVKAWLAYANGDIDEALEYMALAADKEYATEKHVVTPGELLPAAELLGDLLMELDKPDEAVEKYEQSLDRSPGRFNSLYGAGRAAELSGDQKKARKYYEMLVNISSDTEISMDRRHVALAYLNGQKMD